MGREALESAQHSGRVVIRSSLGGVLQSGSGWGIHAALDFAIEGADALRDVGQKL